MTEKICLSIIHEDRQYSSELIKEHISLDEITWEWLKDAFVAIGYDSEKVKEFFSN
jgi:hypothetical protein